MESKEKSCRKCGKCCGCFLPLTEKEKKKIKYLIQRYNIKPQRLRLDLSCPFLDTGNNCVIYDNRPNICKFFFCSNTKIMPKEQFEQMKGAVAVDMWSFFET